MSTPHQLYGAVQQSDILGLADALAAKAGIPYRAVVPAGNATPTITHGLGTQDVDVTVWRVADGVQVGVPVDRIDTNNVTLTFDTAPASGQYRVIVSAGTGVGGGVGGGEAGPHAATHAVGGSDPVSPASIGASAALHAHAGVYSPVDHTHSGSGTGGPHAATHAVGGSDPVSPTSIGAADTEHDHAGFYSPVVHTHNGVTPTGGATGQVLTKNTAANYDYSWQDAVSGGGGGPTAIKPYPPINLSFRNYTDPSNGSVYRLVDINAALGTHFRLDFTSTNPSCGFTKPTNPTPGQSILLELRAVGANGTPTFSATTASPSTPAQYSYGDVSIGTVLANTVDYIVLVYDERALSNAGSWRVMSCTKGFPL